MGTFRDYREKVSILQVAEHLGYKPVKGKFTQARPVLRDDLGDTVIIKNPTNPAIQLYWNLNNPLEHGSVIDFITNNLNRFSEKGRNEVDSINKVLSHFAGIEYDNTKFINHTVSEQKVFRNADYIATQPAVNQLHYLSRERNLSPETIKSFLPFILLVNNDGYHNVAFPFTVPDTDNSVKGYELRNYGGFKSFSAGGDKIHAVWIADFSVFSREVTSIFFFESAIDAMSFFEIKPIAFDATRSVFVSTGGNPALNQFANVLKAYPNAQSVFGCHDNDISGHLFDIQLCCLREGHTLVKTKHAESVKFTVNNKTFELPNEKVNLKRFIKESGLRTNVVALKPNSLKDWNEALKNKNVENPIKKPIFKR
jgi:hypothetical protein